MGGCEEVKSIGYFPTGLIALFIVLLLLLFSAPAYAATVGLEQLPLTLELLQERLNSPIQSDGAYTIDLRQLTIDLTNDNSEFREQFYQQVQTHLNRSKTPLGLDFSESSIQGELIASRLSLRSPLYQPVLPPLLLPTEQEQLQRDERFSSELTPQDTPVTIFRGPIKLLKTRFIGSVNFANTFFLHRIEASDATFLETANWSNSRFSRSVDFTRSTFRQSANFSDSIFFAIAGFSQTDFQGVANFSNTMFQAEANFPQADFEQLANFTRVQWFKTADFSQTTWHERLLMSKSFFTQLLLLINATFDKSTTFRDSQFQQPVLMQGLSLLDQVDFSNARFANQVYLDVAGMTFDSNQAKILGDTGQIGRRFLLPKLQGNEDVLRNLVRNFRLLQQIADANQLEYMTQRLRRQQLGSRLLPSGRKNISVLGEQAGRLAPIILQESSSGVSSPLSWILDGLSWFGLSLLLLLSGYGTSFWLVFGVGLIAIAYFGFLFWIVDRFRRRYPQPITPTAFETPWMLASYGVLTFAGVTAIFRSGDRPWLTLICLGGVVLPVPMILLWRLYQQGRYHDLMDISYFVEDGSMRQLRLLIGRLPVMPRFSVFRDRYMPILWNRRWNWLNYYDFSLNNLLKIGFNDIRLRDEHLPGLISALIWYQWSLGLLYIALLLWTLSRTIPGLNLLIYLK
ncbi:MAG TPA: pentapeptide repeat-containing protein [Coleofasciculaceae cyanobacterium]